MIKVGDAKAWELKTRLNKDVRGRELIRYVQASSITFEVFGDVSLPFVRQWAYRTLPDGSRERFLDKSFEPVGITGCFTERDAKQLGIKRDPNKGCLRMGEIPKHTGRIGLPGADVVVMIRLDSRKVRNQRVTLMPEPPADPDNPVLEGHLGEAENLGHELIHAAHYHFATVRRDPLPYPASVLWALGKRCAPPGTPVHIASGAPGYHNEIYFTYTARWRGL